MTTQSVRVVKRNAVITLGLAGVNPRRVEFGRKAMHRLRMPLLIARRTPRLASIIRRFFDEQGPIVARDIARQYERMGKADTHSASEHFAIRLEWGALAPAVAEELERIYATGALRAFKDVGGDGVFNHVNELARSYAEQRAAEMVGMRWVDGELIENPSAEYAITETTRDSLRALIEHAFEDGLSPFELAREIRDSHSFSAWRAELIAETELATAQEAGSLQGWRASGVVTGKQWILASNHDKEDVCDENASAGVIPLDDTFPTGDDAPPAHPKCKCDAIAEVD